MEKTFSPEKFQVQSPLAELSKNVEVPPKSELNKPIDSPSKFSEVSDNTTNENVRKNDKIEVNKDCKQYYTSDEIEKWRANPKNNGKLVYGAEHSGEVLRKNMETISGENPENSAAHHIVGNETEIASKKLEEFGIDRNDPENGIFLPSNEKSELKGPIHEGRHCREYSNEVDRRFANVSSREECLEVLDALKEDVFNGKLKLYTNNRYKS